MTSAVVADVTSNSWPQLAHLDEIFLLPGNIDFTLLELSSGGNVGKCLACDAGIAQLSAWYWPILQSCIKSSIGNNRHHLVTKAAAGKAETLLSIPNSYCVMYSIRIHIPLWKREKPNGKKHEEANPAQQTLSCRPGNGNR